MSEPQYLGGAHALITGGGTGIGAAIAVRLAQDGARVTLAGRRPGPLEKVAEGLDSAQALPFDVTDEAAVEAGWRPRPNASGLWRS